MKIAILSDIHANYAALEAVTDHIECWNPDEVIIAGDIVNRGPRSGDCLNFLLEKQAQQGWQIIRGNHEDYVLDCASQPNRSAQEYAFYQPVYFAIDQIGKKIAHLEALPAIFSHQYDHAGEFRVVHASMINNRDGVYPETSDFDLCQKIDPAPQVFVTGHTHRPLVRKINQTLVINTGSAGLPFDMDTRPSYAQITLQNGVWQGKIMRVNYDLDQAIADFESSGFLEEGGPIAQIVLYELQSGIGQLYQWTRRYAKPILNGEISVAEATQTFLKKPIAKPYW